MTTPLQVLKSDFFRALAHPTRIRILELLAERERTVQELQHALALDQPIVSQQLAALRGKLWSRSDARAARGVLRHGRSGKHLPNIDAALARARCLQEQLATVGAGIP